MSNLPSDENLIIYATDDDYSPDTGPTVFGAIIDGKPVWYTIERSTLLQDIADRTSAVKELFEPKPHLSGARVAQSFSYEGNGYETLSRDRTKEELEAIALKAMMRTDALETDLKSNQD